MGITVLILILIGIILLVLTAVYPWRNLDNGSVSFGSGIGILLTSLVISIVYGITTIPAIDVYRGKTTLQITQKDGIPIDSVVVYK